MKAGDSFSSREVSLSYYSTQSRVSDPIELRDLYATLPSDLPSLVALAQELVIDKDFVQLFRLKMGKERLAEVDTRYLHEILKLLLSKEDGPLVASRAPNRRFIGSCRDYALLLCSLLRHQGVHARLRFGFATYFSKAPSTYDDHCVCECWDDTQRRWVLVDPNLDPAIRAKLDIKMNAVDVPRDRFVVAADAWKLVRDGKVGGDQFGVMSIGIKGHWFIRGSLMRDLAALNKVEMLPWDYWGLADRDPSDEISDGELPLLDELADALAADDLFTLQALYERSEFKVPATITSYSPLRGPQQVSLI